MKSILIFSTMIFIYSNITFAQSKIEKPFEKYPSGSLAINKKVKINKLSDKKALAQLKFALDKSEIQTGKVGFSSNYEMIIYSVGSGCEQGVMIDVRDGKVYSLPIDCPACEEGNEELNEYKINSRLFVNSFCLDNQNKTAFYLWDENKKKFKKIN